MLFVFIIGIRTLIHWLLTNCVTITQLCILDRRCAFPEAALAFGLHNTSHHHMLSLAGYLQSPPIPELCLSVSEFHGSRPRLLPRTLDPCGTNTMLSLFPTFTCRSPPQLLSGVGTALHRCNRFTPIAQCPCFAWFTITGDGCQPAFPQVTLLYQPRLFC